MRYISLKGEMSVGELARALVDEIGVLQDLKEENTSESLNRRENIQELVSALTEFSDKQPEAKLEDFLAEVSLVSDVDTAEFGRNAVTLMRRCMPPKGWNSRQCSLPGSKKGSSPLAAPKAKGKNWRRNGVCCTSA